MNHKTRTNLLYSMQRIRQIEEAIANRYSEGKMRCPTHLSIGQESVGAALGLALNKDDFVVSSHRAHAHYLGKGGDLKRMIAEIYGKETGCSAGNGGSMHLADPSVGFIASTAIVANSIPIGVGLALSAQLKNSTQVSCCCFGDGAIEEGSFYESANFAALKKLPTVFLCENNLYSVYSPLNVRQPAGRNIHALAQAIGLNSQQVDGSDAPSVLKAVIAAAATARAGQGATFIEIMTYREREHCGPNTDDDLNYRPQQQQDYWRQRDAISLLKNSLLVSDTDNEKFDKNVLLISQEIEQAFLFAEQSAFPSTDTINLHLYAEALGS